MDLSRLRQATIVRAALGEGSEAECVLGTWLLKRGRELLDFLTRSVTY